MGVFPPILSDFLDSSPFLFGGMRGMRESMDIQDDHLTLTVALPGFEQDDVQVHAENGNALLISAHNEADTNDAWTTDYVRRIVLPRGYLADEAVASFKSGLLKVTIAHNDQPQGKRIEISAGEPTPEITTG